MSKPSHIPTRTPGSPLAGAILGRLRERGMTPAHLADEMRRLHPAPLASPIAAASARSQVSRLLSGATAHPSLDTYLLLCRALRTEPTELAVRAGLWQEQDRCSES